MPDEAFPELELKSGHRMPAGTVVELYRLLERHGVGVWIDGGWAVDALLGRQTRLHTDLDVVVARDDVPKVRKLLSGYADVPRDDTSPWNFVLGDASGNQVDIHAVDFDEDGNGVYGPPERGVMYPAASLTGSGTVAGRPVRCISPEWLVRFHGGYTLHDTDFHDVGLLCERFGIPLPDDYRRPGA